MCAPIASTKTASGKTGTQRRGHPTQFSRVRRQSTRGAYDSATIHAILDAATHCHVAHVIDGRPVATPTLHWRRGDWLFWHGSAASRMLGANAADPPADVSWPTWAGVIPLVTEAAAPVPAEDYRGTLRPPRLAGLTVRRRRRAVD